MADEQPTERVVRQRIRNRVIEYLELAASFEEQRRCERAAPIVHVPYEVINLWDDYFPQGLQAEFHQATVYTTDEIVALTAFLVVLEDATRAVPDDYPPLTAVQAMPVWSELREAAADAVAVLMRRGPMPEDHEVP